MQIFISVYIDNIFLFHISECLQFNFVNHVKIM